MSNSFFQKFSFDEKQLKERKKYIGGSEINILATGDQASINQLWETKTGKVEDKDLTTIFPVMMGNITEALNLAWISRKYGYDISMHQEIITSEKHSFMRCTLDGVINNYDNQIAVVDAKFTLGRPMMDETYADVIPRLLKYYTPQLNWNAYLLSEKLGKPVEKGVLSIIRAGSEPIVEEVTIDAKYQEELIGLASYFHGCCQLDTIPEDIITTEPPIPPEKRKPYDMSGNDDWKFFAQGFIQTKGAAQDNKSYENKLKGLVPKDALNCHGHGINIKVSKNFRKSIEII